MTGTDEQFRHGRFGAASPGARPERPSLEELLTVPAKPAGRRRRWIIPLVVAVAVVLGGGGGYLFARFTAPAQPRLVRVLVTDTALPAGARLTTADLRLVTVQRGDSAPPGSLGPAAEQQLLGLSPRVPVPSGTFLTRSLLTAGAAVPGRTHALVGLALHAGQLPSGGISPGERVLIVVVPAAAKARVKAIAITKVWDVQGAGASGTTLATVVVPTTIATQLAGYAARGEVALVATGSRKVPSDTTSPTSPRSSSPSSGTGKK